MVFRLIPGTLAAAGWLRCWVALLAVVTAGWTTVDSVLGQTPGEYRLPQVSPEELGFDSGRLARIPALIAEAIAEEKLPGCVVCFGRRGQIAWLEAYGQKRLEPTPEPMTTDTVFDMASITKPTATATSIMKLVELGQLRLSQKVVDFFPEFAPHGKEAITIRDLLIHQSGLIPDNALADYQQGPEVAWQKICELKLVAPVGAEFKYSDVNFIVLGKLVEYLSGKNVHEFSREMIFAPLGMLDTGYLPAEHLKSRAAPTEKRDDQWIQGEVHDPRAYLLGGVAGHAGLFSTAQDMAIYANMMLQEGELEVAGAKQSILAPATVRVMTAPNRVSSGIRGLGWDKQTGYSSNKGDFLSARAFGHGGFTGTVLWIDPASDLFFILLSNRVHPAGKGSVNGLAGQIVNVLATAMNEHSLGSPTEPLEPVLTGIDVLVRDNFRQLSDNRVGLITNHTGRSRSGVSTVELLQRASSVQLTALFSPEHGFEGKLDIAKIDDSQDTSTGLRVYSLYGQTRRPTADMLANVDTLVFDIQDIGTRFYTYVSTMGEALTAAAEFKKRFVVLDRPNPINGIDVAGPMLDQGSESFVAFHHLPVRHGMTAGELARMFKEELKLEVELQVIQCENWNRHNYWEQSGLTWINPSPNMRSLAQAVLYPGVGLLETTNVSVGRGTDTPFEVMGAPWINGPALAAELQRQSLPGVIFVPIEFTPDSSKYAGELCQGVNVQIVDRAQFQPVPVGLAMAVALRKLHRDQWETTSLNRLLGNKQVAEAILAEQPLSDIRDLSRTGMSDFLKRRQRYVLY